MPLIGLPEGESLKIDTISQNRLIVIKKVVLAGYDILFAYFVVEAKSKIMKFDSNSKKTGSRDLGVIPEGLPPEIKLQVLVSPNQRHIKILKVINIYM